MLRRSFPLAAVAIVLGSAVSYAQTTLFAHLSNGAENPPTNPTLTVGNGGGPRPASFGDATFVIAADGLSMTMDVTVFNIDFTGAQTADTNDDLLNAHIHAGAGVLPNITNGSVVWGFFGSPFNDNAPNDVVVTPFTGGLVGGTVHGKWDEGEGNGNFSAGPPPIPNTLSNNMQFLLSNHAYNNFHTKQFTGGEIRGMIPEPSTATMLVGGLFVALFGSRRR
jgi:hypothetical protein